MAEVLAILASLVHVGTVTRYFLQVRGGSSIPNPSTWVIWVVVSLMNAFSYFQVVRGNWFETGITIVTTAGLSTIFAYSFFRGRFGKVGKVEVASLLLALGVGVLWKTSGDPITANFFLQGVYAVSFVATGRGLLKGELKEHPMAWCIAVVAYTLQVLAILAGWQESSDWTKLVHPIIVGILGNGGIAIIIFKMKNKTPRG